MRRGLFIAVVVLQALVLVAWSASLEWELASAARIRLEVVQRDPRDLLRGDYAWLQYVIADIPLGTIAGGRPDYGDRVWVTLAPQPIRGPRHVPVVDPELGNDEGALEVVPGVLERPVARLARRGRRLLGTQGRRQVVGRDDVARGHDDEPLDHVAQLTDVARPVVGEEIAHRLARQRLGVLAVLGAELADA